MDNNVELYCEVGFIEKFFKSCPPIINNIPDKNYNHWLFYFNLLIGKSDIIFIDISKEDLVNLNDDVITSDVLTLFLNKYAEGKGNLNCMPEQGKYLKIYEEDNQEKEWYCNYNDSIFLFDRDKDACKKLEDDYGLMFISPESLYDRAELLFTPQRKDVSSTTNLWDFMVDYAHPCNTIHLIDNYLLAKKDNVIKDNVKSLFGALLPKKMNKRFFNIHISTEMLRGQNEEFVKEKTNKLKQWIKELREYEIDIHVKFEKNKNHDRNIITNYFLFDSGYGFVLANNERRKGTKLTTFSITHPSTLSSMKSILKE